MRSEESVFYLQDWIVNELAEYEVQGEVSKRPLVEWESDIDGFYGTHGFTAISHNQFNDEMVLGVGYFPLNSLRGTEGYRNNHCNSVKEFKEAMEEFAVKIIWKKSVKNKIEEV